MTIPSVRAAVLALADEGNAAFIAKLIPGLPLERVVGARNPGLRALAKELRRDRPDEAEAFLTDLPHGLHDENMLHAFLLGLERDPARSFRLVEAFLPFVDNWAVCDGLNPGGFARSLTRLEDEVERWLGSDALYTRRFGVCMLMQHFIGERFDVRFPALVGALDSSEYYIRMVQGWYFAEALARQPEAALPWFVEDRLAPDVRRKAIQKAIESYRIPDETKALLREVRATIPRARRR